MMPVFDRIPSKPDPIRRELFNVADLEIVKGWTVADLKPRSYSWSVPFHLNQQNEGACVFHGVVHEAVARPKPVDFRWHPLPEWATYSRALQGKVGATNQDIAQRFAFEGYDECRRNWDEWPGMGYSGTSAAAGAKVAQISNLIGEYRWATTVQDFVTGSSRHGPGCFAIDWWTGMMRPDSDGFIHPTGQVEGGHQILAMSYAAQRFGRPAVGLWQSWGDMPIWWMYVDELEEVVASNGEMVIPTARSL
jgi:hypothetical protein